MPTLPTFIAHAPDSVPLQPFANPAEASQVGAAMARSGELGDVASAWLDKYADQRRATDASNAVAGFAQQASDAKLKWSKVPNQAAATAGYQQDVGYQVDENGQVQLTPGGLLQKTLDNISDPLTKDYVHRQIVSLAIGNKADVQNASFSLEAAQRVGDIDTHSAAYAQQIAQAAGNPHLQAMLADNFNAEVNGAVQAGQLRGDVGAQKLIEFRQNVARVQAEQDRNAAIASNNPAAISAWAKRINDPTQYPDLNPQVRETLGYRADFLQQRAQDQAQVQARAGVRSAFTDNLVALERTGAPAVPLSEAQIRAAYPEEADGMLRQLNTARDVYHAVQSSALTSPAEDAALIQKWTPAGAGFAEQAQGQDALQKALGAKYKALQDDPAGYVLNAVPAISALYQQAQKDPTKLSAALGAIDSAYDKLGVAPADRRVLPTSAAQQLTSQIMATPDQAPQTMKQLAQQYGDAWPRVFHDLSTAGGLPATFQAIPVLANERDGAMLARWLAELPNGKAASDLIGTKNENDIKASVRADPGVQSLLASLSRSGASVAQTDSVLNAIDALGFAKSYYDRDPKAALDAAAAFTGNYEFMPNGGARVPHDVFDAVNAQAGATLQRLSPDGIAVPPIYGQPGMPSVDDYLATLRAAPTWITAPRADALWLMDAAGRIVRDKQGRPVAVPFDSVPSPNPSPKMPGADELMMQGAAMGMPVPALQ